MDLCHCTKANVFNKVIKAGICLADFLYHLAIFCTVANKLSMLNEADYFRDFFHFDSESFFFSGQLNDDVNQNISNLLADIPQTISNKNAP